MRSGGEKLSFISDLRQFGKQALGLQFDGSFKRLEPKFHTANWLYAVHPDRLQSAFRGNDTFRFTWQLPQAKRWEKYHRHHGRHTYLYSAEAHGGARCPITPSMLASARARQCYVVLHEAWHSTLRLQNIRMPYALEEASGRVVGVMGAVAYAKKLQDKSLLQEAEDQAKDWLALAKFVNRSHVRLSKLYSRRFTLLEQKALFRSLQKEAGRLSKASGSGWEQIEFNREMNNAFFFRYHDYTHLYPLSIKVFEKSGSLVRAMNRYKKAGQTAAINQLKALCRA